MSLILSHLKKIDHILAGTIVCLCFFGLLMVYSASYPLGEIKYGQGSYFFMKQWQWLLIGFFFFIAAALVPYQVYRKWIRWLVMLSLLCLILVLLPGIGVVKNNSQRWIQLGSLIIQPSEAVKLVMIIYSPMYMQGNKRTSHPLRSTTSTSSFKSSFFIDFKTARFRYSSFYFIELRYRLIMCWTLKRHLILLGSTAAAGITFFAVTAPYRLKRITSFRDPFMYEDGDGYQLIHSYLAMDSGGLTGNGLGGSIQKLGFLPEAHTDFIMAIISEELGIMGLLFVMMGAYLLIMYRAVRIVQGLQDPFGKLLTIGLTFQIMIQAAFNLGAVFGLLPITGIPLPFISYGGSSLVFMMISAGILVNLSSSIKRHRHVPQVK